MENIASLFAGPWGPVIIFFARIADVSLDTVRILLITRHAKAAAPIIGFFQVLIWIIVVGNAIRNLDSTWHIFGYAAGFATGNLVGIWIEEKMAFGFAIVRVISQKGGVKLAEGLRARGFGVTQFAGQGREGAVQVVYSVLRRRQIPEMYQEINQCDPTAFVTVEEPRAIRSGWVFAPARRRRWGAVRL